MQKQTSQVPLRVETLTYSFGDICVLNEVSLELPPRGITALLGSNGAGKTTLVNFALGLLKPSQGRIEVLGEVAGSRAAKQQVGVMLQDADLPELLSAREHIALFSAYYADPIPASELLIQCELDEFADKKYKQLSGGQKRRVQFALAILGRPKVLFLDEPTVGLDSDARRVLWNTIRSLSNTGVSVLLTTHYLEEADSLAENVIVIDKGEIVAQGATSEIRQRISGSVIRCQTQLDPLQVATMQGVRSAKRSGRYLEVLSDDSAQTLNAMMAADSNLSELSILKPSLENAFNQLTKNTGEFE